MGTPKEMAKTLVEPEVDDVLALNGTQGTWSAAVELGCPWAEGEPDRGLAQGTHAPQSTGQGRVERRRTTVTDALAWRQGQRERIRRSALGW